MSEKIKEKQLIEIFGKEEYYKLKKLWNISLDKNKINNKWLFKQCREAKLSTKDIAWVLVNNNKR